MNLVAKEFVAARDDEQGVLMLSQFTGAARDLAEALIVNPYDIEQSAAAMHLALTMSPRGAARAHAQHAQAWCRSSTSTAGPGACCSTPARMRHRSRGWGRARRMTPGARPAACAKGPAP